MLQAAVVGVGHLGKIHAEKYYSIPDVQLSAIVDLDNEKASAMAAQFQCQSYTDYNQLPQNIQLVSVAVDTEHHYRVARDLLSAGKHLLIEKPICETSDQAEELVAFADSKGLLIQVGHIERFNPAVIDAKQRVTHPAFIECIRLAPFMPRPGAQNVNVVFDLMIHDIDLVLSFVGQPVEQTASIGSAVVTDDIDIVNSRIQFTNGCVANITASRISHKTERTLRIFQKGMYITANLREKTSRIYTMDPAQKGKYLLENTSFNTHQRDSLQQQILAFVHSVRDGKPAHISGKDGLNALKLAQIISQQAEDQAH